MKDATTRQRLINTIIDMYCLAPGKKIKISHLSETVGISRQSFHRFYGDLKAYATGEKPVSELISSTGVSADQTRLLVEAQAKVNVFSQELVDIEAEHAKKLEIALTNHVTSLMNSDIALFESAKLQSTVNRQAKHIAELSRQLDDLKVTNNSVQIATQNTDSLHGGNIVIIDTDLADAHKRYNNNDHDKYIEEKIKSIDKCINTALSYPNVFELHIFIDLYLVTLDKFVSIALPPQNNDKLIISLPIFSEAELYQFAIRKLKKHGKPHIHIPYIQSISRRASQRSFFIKNTPAFELEDADNSEKFSMNENYLSLKYYNIGELCQ